MAERLDPYVGHRPFERTEEDRSRFFGRDRETEEIVSLVVSHPLLLVYAQSGAGKTSLFEAQVAPALETKGFEVLPLARVRAAIPAGTDPDHVRNVYASSALLSIAPDEEPERLVRSSLKRFLRKRPTPRCLVFDQFEEIFTDESVYALRPRRWQEEQAAFFRQVAAAVAADPLLRAVLIVRKEYLAELDRFLTLLPERLRARYHLEPLARASAVSAVRRPVEELTERSFADGVPERLVDGLLLMRIDVGGEVQEVRGRYVEPLHLQLVCESLWRELRPGETVITEEDVRTYGDIDQVLGELYDSAVRAVSASMHVPEARLRRRIESDFITPSGTRAPIFVDEGADGEENAELIAELERRHLIRAEEWRPGARLYELTHDRLVEPIRASNEAYRAAVARRRRRLLAFALAVAALAGAVATAVVLLTAGGGGEFDLKRYAALPSRGRPQAALSAASFSPDGNYIVTAGADGAARIWDWTTNTTAPLHTLKTRPAALSAASFSPDGNYVVTASADGDAQIWAWRTKPTEPVRILHASPKALSSASFSPGDGRLVVTAGLDGVARVWDWCKEQLEQQGTAGAAQCGRITPADVLGAGGSRPLSSASFSPEGTEVVTAGADGVAQVWSLLEAAVVARLSAGDRARLTSAAFNSDGKLIVTGGEDGAARVWKWCTEAERKPPCTGHVEAELREPGRVTSTAFSSPGGQFVLTAGTDGTARIWGWNSNKDPAVLRQARALSSAAFSPVGALVVTASELGFATIYSPNQVG